MTKCKAHLSNCHCGLDDHGPDVPHECEAPDPQCGGSWFDHPTMPDHVLVVRYPGLRPGGPNEQSGLVHDPEPGEPALEPRPPDMVFIPGFGYMPVLKAPRGGIKVYPPPDLREILHGNDD